MVPCWTAWSSTDRKEPQQKGTGTLKKSLPLWVRSSRSLARLHSACRPKMRRRWRKGDLKRGDKRRPAAKTSMLHNHLYGERAEQSWRGYVFRGPRGRRAAAGRTSYTL